MQSANRHTARLSGEHSAGVAEVVVGQGEAGATHFRDSDDTATGLYRVDLYEVAATGHVPRHNPRARW